MLFPLIFWPALFSIVGFLTWKWDHGWNERVKKFLADRAVRFVENYEYKIPKDNKEKDK